MAISAGFTTRIYGEVQGSPPFADANGATAFTRVIPFTTAQLWSMPSTPVQIVPLPNGFQMPSGNYVYSVIMVPPTGLNVHGDNFVTDTLAATLATSRG